ncbi:hypothetical protein GCM10023165_54510 [Variovorax defluvii]|uniref:HTH lysR-type domain-containing protein n=1 Tax=Variovorax defluvii TaxID=913761 RepID=A0ABP8IHR9_9BURK
MNLTLRQLRAFDAVAETGCFTAAAARLHLTQSALSVLVRELVRELEREMGVQLFDRHTRRVLLSEAGRAFQPSVQRLLADLCHPARRSSRWARTSRWNPPPSSAAPCSATATG